MKLSSKLAVALIAVSTMGVALPAMAQKAGNAATAQTTNQTTVITGDNNVVYNIINQRNGGGQNGKKPGKPAAGNTATVQSSNQVNDIQGNNNTVSNVSNQTNVGQRGGAAGKPGDRDDDKRPGRRGDKDPKNGNNGNHLGQNKPNRR